jgi:hypothetical protein
MVDEVHNHPTVQRLLKWQKAHHWLIGCLVVALIVVAVLWHMDHSSLMGMKD